MATIIGNAPHFERGLNLYRNMNYLSIYMSVCLYVCTQPSLRSSAKGIIPGKDNPNNLRHGPASSGRRLCGEKRP